MNTREAVIHYIRATLKGELTIAYIEETSATFQAGIGFVILSYQVMKFRDNS
jgi:hypothetical protein